MDKALADKILAATNGTQLGAILRCAIDGGIQPAPCFVGKAIVTSDGFVMCDFFDRDGVFRSGAFVGSLEDLDRNLIGLSKHLQLAPAQYNALAAEVTNWIGKDRRSSTRRRG